MNENEKLSILFKQEQIKSNKLFSDQIKLLNEEVNNIKNANPIDRSNFITIEKNFKIINKALESKIKDINLLEQSIKTYIEIIKVLSDKLEKIKKMQIIQEMKNLIRDSLLYPLQLILEILKIIYKKLKNI